MNLKRLEEEQIKLAKKVVLKDDFDEINYIAGCDEAYFDNYVISAIAVLEIKTFKLVDVAYAFKTLKFAYIAGFLSYRLAPCIIEAYAKLKQKPDVLMVNASGIVHPRKFGLASHLGLFLDVPTIGVSKKLAYGTISDDKIICEGEKRGVQIRTKEFAKPLYVNPGHRITIKTAARVFNECLEGNKLPEPLRIAHKLVTKKREELRLNKEKPED